MAKETEKVPAEISPKIAFLLSSMAENPEVYLRVDRDRGGLTYIGEVHYTPILRKELRPILEVIKNDPHIAELANQYKREIQDEDGTVAVSLNPWEREIFDHYLQNTGLNLSGLFQQMISTNITI